MIVPTTKRVEFDTAFHFKSIKYTTVTKVTPFIEGFLQKYSIYERCTSFVWSKIQTL